jgi:uncharacterized membrane protein YdjX (TVP38/TMEM64 family)
MNRARWWRNQAFSARAMGRGLLLIASLVAFGVLLQATRFGAAFDQAWVDHAIRNHGVSGELLFVAVAVMLTTLGLPRQFVAFLGGYAFGLVEGALLALLGTVLSCIAAFYYARLLARGVIARRLGKRARRVDGFLRSHPFSTTLSIRLLPIGHNLATNLVAGVSSIAPVPFFVGSAVGYLPQTLVFALVGSGVETDPVLRTTAGVVLFLVSGALGAWLHRRHRRVRALARELAPELAGGAPPAASSH